MTTERIALYFGARERVGHYLWDPTGRYGLSARPELYGCPWDLALMDGGLLGNRKVPDEPDGRVHWTSGGHPIWIALFWWDRSVDRRPASNSGFYVRGFDPLVAGQVSAALDYAVAAWPDVASRQVFPLTFAGEVP
jgi:hypothetical protein